MSNVIDLPKRSIKLTRVYCEECELPVTYWLGTDDCAYGLCPSCDLNIPDEIDLSTEEIEH